MERMIALMGSKDEDGAERKNGDQTKYTCETGTAVTERLEYTCIASSALKSATETDE